MSVLYIFCLINILAIFIYFNLTNVLLCIIFILCVCVRVMTEQSTD